MPAASPSSATRSPSILSPPPEPAGRYLLRKDLAIVTTLQELVEPDTAGDPMSEQKWVRVSLRQLSGSLGRPGIR